MAFKAGFCCCFVSLLQTVQKENLNREAAIYHTVIGQTTK